MLLPLTPTEETGETKVRADCLNFDVSQFGLPDAFCKNTGHFVSSDKSRLHSQAHVQWHWIFEKH